jgi:2-oxoglutarate dehydrogenase E1 component
MDELSFINNAHPQYIDSLYKDYLKDPQSVETSWRTFFDGFQFAQREMQSTSAARPEIAQKEMAVFKLINAYRSRGHLFTKTNPVRTRRQYKPSLDLETFDIDESDLDTIFQTGHQLGLGPVTLKEIVDHLQETYCSSIGVEYMFIRIPERVKWLQDHIETNRNRPNFSIEQKRRILHKLNQAVGFENFLHTKYIGQKRFSLQGGETLIPGLDAVVEKGSELGIEEFIIGMPHRGRLSVLANIVNKEFEEIFSEFEGVEHSDAVFEGDVKYHLGYSNTVKTSTGKTVKIAMAPNPSHLESVNPVVEGMVRSKIDHTYDGDHSRIIPILIHGDAAMAAQGVVYEVIQMSLLKGYKTGGTIHLVVNNQLGFTTNYLDGRSSTYCTDVAKVTLSPVFHVNADDAEAVVQAVQLAMEYRQTFHTDVFIDLLGYRKFGHNETDEPRFTQPKLYKVIAEHPDPREIYSTKLMERDHVDQNLAKEMDKEFKAQLSERHKKSKRQEIGTDTPTWINECDLKSPQMWHSFDPIPTTKVSKKHFLELGLKLFTPPDNIQIFDKIRKLYQTRKDRMQSGEKYDWAMGEMLAYATLLDEGTPIRLSGQDSERGTFSHRHSILRDEETEEKYLTLNNIKKDQAQFQIIDSLLSEFGVLGFEYGYACATPEGLTIWEAQFGDFNNAAQVLIDQYISSSEAKWKRSNGLVLFLPHGYEGQGPEHSSARIERFLSLSANGNMHIVNCTTPANFFHVLRAHVKYAFRLPLIAFTPKSLLRHPKCVSTINDFSKGEFQRVIDDSNVNSGDVKKVLFCSGKIYYELLEHQQKENLQHTAIVRLEQLYPIPKKELQDIIDKYAHANEFVWVQEEPENMGAWSFLALNLNLVELSVIAREKGSTPATGYFKQHQREQQTIIQRAFTLKAEAAVNTKKSTISSKKSDDGKVNLRSHV